MTPLYDSKDDDIPKGGTYSMKRFFLLLLAACMLVSLALPALAEETEETEDIVLDNEITADTSGTCGENLTWVLEGNTLTISGSGAMDDGSPWDAHRKKIKNVILKGGVTSVGAKAFFEYDRLEYVDFGDALVEIGEKAFAGCTDLAVIHLPATFRTFGAEAFQGCSLLRRVYCDGGMPRFNQNCLWTGEYISVFYPTTNSWPADAVNQLVSNFSGRLGVMMGNWSEDVLTELGISAEKAQEEEESTEETTEPEETEEPTEAAEETIAETEEAPETVPVMVTEPEETAAPTETEEPTEEPATEAPTEAVTQEPTEAPTEPAPDLEDLTGKSWIGIVLIGVVLLFLLAGTIIFKTANKKGGRYNR